MTQKKLQACFDLAKDLKRQREDIEHLRCEMERTTAILSGSRGGGSSPDRIGELMARLDESVHALMEDSRRHRALRREIMDWTQAFTFKQRNVIRYRYIEALPWNQVATLSRCAQRTAYSIYEQIVKNIPLK